MFFKLVYLIEYIDDRLKSFFNVTFDGQELVGHPLRNFANGARALDGPKRSDFRKFQ